MKRNAIAALLVVAVAVGAGAFAVGSQSQSPATVRGLEVIDSECDDGAYESRVEQRHTDGGTRVVVEDVFVGPAPDHGLDAALSEETGDYTLTLTPRETTADENRDCTGELHYRAVVFVPAEAFDLTVVHGDETHVVLGNDETDSSAESNSAARERTRTPTESVNTSVSSGAADSASSGPATTTE
ncbi:hypothetical protein [Halorussus lipolyticus]|uniref:hypothetical protein n=1 Tax=Halorussus lipolyticus TaxID=3034024 RepID=UPI0023E800A4|nr:hypothetical protein [Halorussus sp. DT80]